MNARLTKALLMSAVAGATAFMAVHAGAAEGPWCAIYGDAEGGQNCYFVSFQQCMADLSGRGGWCQPNPNYGAPVRRKYRR